MEDGENCATRLELLYLQKTLKIMKTKWNSVKMGTQKTNLENSIIILHQKIEKLDFQLVWVSRMVFP